jgi:hypothetical protein
MTEGMANHKQFLDLYDKAASFPRSLSYHDTYEHNLVAYVKRLDERETKLFSSEENGSIDLQEYNVCTRGKRQLKDRAL